MTESKKVIGKYKVHFKKSLNESGEFVTLSILLGKEMKELLKSVTIPNYEQFVYNFGCDEQGNDTHIKYKRYKVKRIVYSYLSSNSRDLLFIKELIDTGEINLNFLEAYRLEKALEHIREDLKKLVEIVLKYDDVTQQVVYHLN